MPNSAMSSSLLETKGEHGKHTGWMMTNDPAPTPSPASYCSWGGLQVLAADDKGWGGGRMMGQQGDNDEEWWVHVNKVSNYLFEYIKYMYQVLIMPNQ